MQKKITHFNLLTVRPHCNIYPINKLHFYEIKEVGFVLNKINPTLKLQHPTVIINSTLGGIFDLLLGCPTPNFRPFSRGQALTRCQSLCTPRIDPKFTRSLVRRPPSICFGNYLQMAFGNGLLISQPNIPRTNLKTRQDCLR